MPPGFEPVPGWPPMWLMQDHGIVVAGRIAGRTEVFSFSGEKFQSRAKIGEDFGPLADGGRIVDIAVNPDGSEIATAVVIPNPARIEIVFASIIGGGKGTVAASFDGGFTFASIVWKNNTTLALTLGPESNGPRTAPAPPDQSAEPDATQPASGLYLIGVTGLGAVSHLDQIKCPLGRVNFSPNGRFAASGGTIGALPVIVDTTSQACVPFGPHSPVKILGWSPDSTSLLYAGDVGPNHLPGAFRYNLVTGATSVAAIASPSAAFASDGTLVALGDNELTWRRTADYPHATIKSEIALFSPITSEITINSLGFAVTPKLLAESSMAFTQATDDAAIDLFSPTPNGVFRTLIDYSYPARQAFALASGAARGPLLMSWSHRGSMLAVLDGVGGDSKLTIFAPPR
ncbi:hypothetical protein IMX07_01200 [bacterium]|nr:hypothetical protein [bacterium]